MKTALQRGIFFNILAIFIERSGTHAMQFAARECRLQHISRVDCAFGLACAYHRVQFVNKNNGLAFILRDFFEHGFEPLFKLTSVFRARQQRRHVERQHTLVL